MNLASHEAYELNELILSCVNTITNMGLFLNQVKDEELRQIIERQYAAHIMDYNIKVQYLSDLTRVKEKLPIPELNVNSEDYLKEDIKNVPVAPKTDATELNDREIGTSYLLTLKRAGREYAWSTMEATNPSIREFLEDAFKMASHHAFEVGMWMVKNGYYPIIPANKETLNILGKMYNKIEIPSSLKKDM